MKRITSIPVIAAAMLAMSAVSANAMDVNNCKDLFHCLNNSIDITLTSDIKMDNKAFKDYIDYEHTPCYRATFDGQGHKIYGIDGCSKGATNIGLIHWSNFAKIKNVTVEYDRLTAERFVGGIVGQARNTSIDNCHVKGYLTSVAYTRSDIGGIVGKGTNCYITNCTADINIYADGDDVGGIIGNGTEHNIIRNCQTDGCIFADGNSTDANCGGIVGSINAGEDYVDIIDCINNSRVDAKSSCVGGIVGYVSEAGNLVIDNCVNNGAVAAHAGGIFASDLSRFYGGIIGDLREGKTFVTNCTNTGAISGDSGIGAFVGKAFKDTTKARFENCNAGGKIYTKDTDANAFCGGGIDNIIIVNPTNTAEVYRNNQRIDSNSTQSLASDLDVQPAEPAKQDAAKKVMAGGKLTLVKSNGQIVDISGMMR